MTRKLTFNLPTSRRVITETYSSETDWYRVWSDGWCEQGGVQIGNGSYGLIIVNLLKNYRDTNYSIYVSILWSGTSSEWYTGTFTPTAETLTDIVGPSINVTASNFQIQGFSNHRWYTCGYISNYIPLNDIIKY